ncbi:cupin domain-containing protein [Pseudobacteriovorax antillogorgiicola]|uniref:DUF985 domain-containing protein n=1 Tax=Pseudobacteriovorax antillogorgiicola TaxID=1513793 RepID=A0A1Y6BID6_9BACT|nr:cupin domain-containing protein [Pseudobacteriovorax antillogorgiicola]TCS55551.1 hypothetical protein EDD56_105277 [Pseudobacteriovorax antillogorgiicola]SMF11043.1 hypothetical protein SAMN06296036_10547 [Pseudobacteriovorax antillogorgiicola]
MSLNAAQIIKSLELTAHPEGGYFRETYRSLGDIHKDSVEPGMTGSRSYSTAIYFLLDRNRPSKFHRIKSDEIWHFHLGSAIDIVEIDESGQAIVTTLGAGIDQGQTLQHVVAKNRWFGARLHPSGREDFGLVSCTVAPGFDFADFAMATKEDLGTANGLNDHQDLIP